MIGRTIAYVISYLEEKLIILFLAAMTILTFAQVVLRYAPNYGINTRGALWDLQLWHLEGTSFLFLWMVLIGICYGVRVGSHIGVDLFIRAMPSNTQWILSLIAATLGLTYAAIMFFSSYNAYALFGDFYRELDIRAGYVDQDLCLNWEFQHLVPGIECLTVNTEELPIKRWILFLVLPIGFGLLFLRISEVWRGIFKRERLGFSTSDHHRGLEEIPQHELQEAQTHKESP